MPASQSACIQRPSPARAMQIAPAHEEDLEHQACLSHSSHRARRGCPPVGARRRAIRQRADRSRDEGGRREGGLVAAHDEVAAAASAVALASTPSSARRRIAATSHTGRPGPRRRRRVGDRRHEGDPPRAPRRLRAEGALLARPAGVGQRRGPRRRGRQRASRWITRGGDVIETWLTPEDRGLEIRRHATVRCSTCRSRPSAPTVTSSSSGASTSSWCRPRDQRVTSTSGRCSSARWSSPAGSTADLDARLSPAP